jgi:hypothetical protein
LSGGVVSAFVESGVTDAFELSKQGFAKIWLEPSSLRIGAGALSMLVSPSTAPKILVNSNAVARGDTVNFLEGIDGSGLQFLPGEGRGAAIARAAIANAGIVAAGKISVTSSGADVTIAVQESGDRPGALAGDGLGRLQDLFGMAQRAAQYERSLGVIASWDTSLTDSERRNLIVAALGIVQDIYALVLAARTVGTASNGKFDLLTLLDAAIQGRLATQLCPSKQPPVVPDADSTPIQSVSICQVFEQIAGLADPTNVLRPILDAARQQDYRALAASAVNAVFSPPVIEEMCCGAESSSCETQANFYGRLANTIVSYVLMDKDDQDAALAARAAFKAAAVDVIREADKRGGLDRHWANAFWLPTAALRASWSQEYAFEDSRRSGIRYTPTLDWPNLRIRVTKQSSPIYIGAKISLFDALAPFSEIVSQRSELKIVHYPGMVALTAIQPRVSAFFGVPALSQHTVVSLGASVRGAAEFSATCPQSSGSQECAAYETPISRSAAVPAKDSDLERFEHLFEVSAAIEYIP